MKIFMMEIRNDDYIVRDHRVHGLRIMPGVTFLDIILRIFESENIPVDRTELQNVVFSEPISTTEAYDKRISIELIEDGDVGEIVGRSQKIKGGVALESSWSENIKCKVAFNKELISKNIDLERLKRSAKKVVSLDEMYARVRDVMITHYEFMKGLGSVYVGDGYLLAEVHLSDLAKDYLDYFYAHPAYLDCSTLIPLVHYVTTRGAALDKPYIPLFIEKFRATGKLGELCYVYMEPEGSASERDDILYNDLELYDANGQLAAKIEKLAAKRIRSEDLITRLSATRDIARPGEFVEPQPILSGGHEIIRKLGPDLASSTNVSSKELIENDLQKMVASLLGKNIAEIKNDVGFYDLGLDSTQLLKIVRDIEAKLGEQLYPTLLFEYTNIRDLAGYFDKEYGERYTSRVCAAPISEEYKPVLTEPDAHAGIPPRVDESARATATFRGSSRGIAVDDAIAIVGLSGRYPKADNLRQFWANVLNGRDCVTEVPKDHWDYRGSYGGGAAESGKPMSKWGGFVDGVDKFDPLFFKISPRDAEIMDPQLRLLLERAWEVIEDSGYTPHELLRSVVGVYVGVMNDDYTWVAAESYFNTGKYSSPGSYANDLANRISYHMNFNGPSLAIETACSSSLTAIHMARMAILSGECDVAVAGGVNLNVHRSKYLMLSGLGIMSAQGKERAFDASADGYVPAEGIGLVLLKSLKKAVADNDHIYAVIRGSAINHSGAGAGRFVPNVNELTAVADKAISESGIDAERIEYIETHGTGTPLGDPIELRAMAKAINRHTQKRGYCALGSKSNLGHMESASGICSLTKVLLSMQYGMIPKCPNVTEVNPSIPLDTYPFYIPYEPREWKAGALPRVACINSFGVGGSNCFMVVEEYKDTHPGKQTAGQSESGERLVVLSAKNKERLKEYAREFIDYLEQDENQGITQTGLDLGDVAYTLQVGREAMEERIAVIAKGPEELKIKLMEYINDKQGIDGLHSGNIKEVKDSNGLVGQDDDGKQYIKELFAKNHLSKIAAFWVGGSDIDWKSLYKGVGYHPVRISLPTYPFKRDRYWLHDEAGVAEAMERAGRPGDLLFSKGMAKAAKPTEGSVILEEEWIEVGISGNAAPLMGAVLLMTCDEDICGNLKRKIGEKNRIIQVSKGDGYKELSEGKYEVSAGEVGDYKKLVEKLRGKDIHIDKVVYLWEGEEFKEGLEEVGRGLEGGIYSLYGLTRALMEGKPREEIKVLCVIKGEGLNPLMSGLSGFMRSANLENPKLKYKTISLETDLTSEDMTKVISEELGRWGDKGVAELKYEGGKRYERKFREMSVSVKGKPALKEGGVYAITGGMGGLGLIFAKYLSKEYKAKLVLSGRRNQDAEVERQIREISELGGEAIYFKCDVIKRDEVRRLLRAGRERFGRIDGILHAAGILRDAFIIKKTREDFETVMGPKVYGSINLDEASREDDLDVFALFSSISGVTGNVGQADYAFGNRFMDHFAEWRQGLAAQGKRKGKTISIDWPLWEEGGMMVDDEVKKWMKQSAGMTVMPTAEGLEAFEIGLGSGSSHVSVFHGDERRIRKLLGAEVSERASVRATDSGITGKMDAAALIDKVGQDITNLVTEILKVKGEDIDIDADMSEYGFDSITITELMSRLNSMFDIELTPSALVENRSIGAMAGYLVRTYKDKFSINEQAAGSMELETLGQETTAKHDKKSRVEENIPGDIACVKNLYSITATELKDVYGEKGREADKCLNNVNISFLNLLLKNYSESAHLLVPSNDGTKIDVLVAGRGEPILFIPPWGMTSRIWTLQIREWASGNQVIGLNLPGHGLSERCDDYSIENLGRILIEVIEKLDINSPMHIVGASYGGVIAQVIAGKLRDRIASLTLVNSLCNTRIRGEDVIVKRDMDREISKNAGGIMLYLNERSSEDFNKAVNTAKNKKGEFRKEDLEDLFIKSSVLDPVAALEYGETLFSYDTSDLLADLNTPTLIVIGEKDIVINSTQSRMINAIIPRSKIVAIKGGGHHCFLTHYKKFNELVGAFIKNNAKIEKVRMSIIKKKKTKKEKIMTDKSNGHIRFNVHN